MKIAVLGLGSWGTALARVLAINTAESIYVWDRDEAVRLAIINSNINSKFLPKIILPNNLKVARDFEFLGDIDLIVPVVPTQALRGLLQAIKPFLKAKAAFLLCSKGIENNSDMLATDVLKEVIGERAVAVLSGPNFADEVVLDFPTATLIASKNFDLANKIILALFSKTFRCYYSDDVVGVEILGAVKNVLAIASGVSSGLGYRENTKAMIIARGVAEIDRILARLGGKTETLIGLAGVGDIMLTCNSVASRNMQFGYRLGQGEALDKAMNGQTVEGYFTCKSIYNICKKYGIDAPIINATYQVLYQNKPVKIAVAELLSRDISFKELTD